jgi:hypothetical protein
LIAHEALSCIVYDEKDSLHTTILKATHIQAKYGSRRTVDLAVSPRQGSGERESAPLISEAIPACVSNIPIYISLILLDLQSGGWFEICCTRKRCLLML